jgi:hydrogenase/urease accessory protein HupE
LTVALLFAPAALSHEVGLSDGDYTWSNAEMSAEIQISIRDLVYAFPRLDANEDGDLSRDEIEDAASIWSSSAAGLFPVRQGEQPCATQISGLERADDDGVKWAIRAQCPDDAPAPSLKLSLLEKLPRGHRHVAQWTNGTVVLDRVLHARDATWQPMGEVQDAPPVASAYLILGVEHILIGADHLLFVFALILVGGRLRQLALVITAFTLGHSVTLVATTLGWVAPDMRWVEAAIALSVAWVGLENFWLKDASRRWMITLPFGLIHGFGFASVLSDIGLPKADEVLALALFNVGVEVGQLMVLALALPLVMLARRNPWFRTVGVRAVSIGVIAVGVMWFVERTLG